MNKSDLVDAVASSADVTKASAGRAVDAVLGLFLSDIELQEKEEIHKQVLQCILQHQKFQALKLVKD